MLKQRQHPRVGAFLLMRLELKSPCKVNLLLNILGKREDGFHELETIMQPVALFDCLRFETRDAAGVELTCSDPALPADSANLVHRAATAFQRAASVAGGVRIHLDKRIPLAAGLGGGSSNAAHTLLGLNEMFAHPLTAEQLTVLGAMLGSDVPFFLQSSPALASGRGEKIRMLKTFPALQGAFIVLVYPGFGISTAWAYQQLSRFPNALHGEPGRAERLASLLEAGDLAKAAPEFYNALEGPALEKYPLLRILQEFIRGHGAPVTLMSGSGSTTFAIAPTQEAADELAEGVRAKFGEHCWVSTIPLQRGLEF